MTVHPDENVDEQVTVEVYDSTMTLRLGWVSQLIDMHVITQGEGTEVGVATLIVADTDPRVSDLTADDARVIIYGRDGDYLMSGWVEEQSGSLPAVLGQVTVTVVDDCVLFDDVLGWPNPTLSAVKQGANDTDDVEAYYTVKGPAETVVKNLVQKNAIDRLMLPVVCAPDLGRGEVITVKIRMHPLRDQLFPAVNAAGIGVTARQINGKIVVDCYTPELYPRTISEDMGIVVGGDYKLTAPTTSRVIVGGGGEGKKRVFHERISYGRETRYGRVMESFRDARDAGTDWDQLNEQIDNLAQQIKDTDDAARKTELTNERDGLIATKPEVKAEYDALMVERAKETIAEGAEQSALNVILTETESFRVGQKPGLVKLLTQIPVEVREGTVITDRVTGIDYSYKAGQHYIAVPILGRRPKDTQLQLSRSIAALFKGLRKNNVR